MGAGAEGGVENQAEPSLDKKLEQKVLQTVQTLSTQKEYKIENATEKLKSQQEVAEPQVKNESKPELIQYQESNYRILQRPQLTVFRLLQKIINAELRDVYQQFDLDLCNLVKLCNQLLNVDEDALIPNNFKEILANAQKIKNQPNNASLTVLKQSCKNAVEELSKESTKTIVCFSSIHTKQELTDQMVSDLSVDVLNFESKQQYVLCLPLSIVFKCIQVYETPEKTEQQLQQIQQLKQMLEQVNIMVLKNNGYKKDDTITV
ncbi:Hypothetical_protein [Hexamita inflata]|uniref:Hypothetical_protein n=1 Tax=Hexamita inflata TaxID=28002 RepID=A0AA86Q1W5_9EUKA|nr:Hypothetical protein HINF_LOCUS32512 [Hexamita inflata]